MADLTILDVGHGNCAILRDDKGAVVIDAGLGSTLLEFLEQRKIYVIDAVLISHADADHVSGLLALLAQQHIIVRTIFLNTETLRKTALWHQLCVALADARQRRAVKLRTELTTASSEYLFRDGIEVQILAPPPELALVGAGGLASNGQRLTANSMSAVVRVVVNGIPEVLLPGDLDIVGLEHLLSEHPNPRARILVFPHHGGRPGKTDAEDFAVRLCTAVQADVVVFSIGRGKHATPYPDIIRGVLRARPGVHIACTQLSERCAASLPSALPSHLDGRPARGRAGNACCAGTIEVMLGGEALNYTPSRVSHRIFIEREAPTALCMGAWHLRR